MPVSPSQVAEDLTDGPVNLCRTAGPVRVCRTPFDGHDPSGPGGGANICRTAFDGHDRSGPGGVAHPCRTPSLDRSVSPCRTAEPANAGQPAGPVNSCRGSDVNACRTGGAAGTALNDSDAAALAGMPR